MEAKKTLNFWKYQGTGNDFVLVDNRALEFPKGDNDLIATLCHRRFGIGADGLILLEKDAMLDFKMVYYNSDGNESTMCGNGGRCLVAFAKELGIIDKAATFRAIDGPHEAVVQGEIVELKMIDVDLVSEKEKYSFLDTGSPHHVQKVNGLDALDVHAEGQRIRYGLYGQKGSNINFVEQESHKTFKVRTYERGVEGETLSCGTGVTAVALAMHHVGDLKADEVVIRTQGGDLGVRFEAVEGGGYTNITLSGPAQKVYEGQWQL